MHTFDYRARDELKKGEVKEEMREKRLILRVDRHFSAADMASAGGTILGKNSMNNVPQKKRL